MEGMRKARFENKIVMKDVSPKPIVNPRRNDGEYVNQLALATNVMPRIHATWESPYA
jgi:hypothetical protein